VLFGIVATMTNLNNGLWNRKYGVVIHDVISYYSYLPAVFIYHDLSFSYLDKNPQLFAGKVFNSKTTEGGHYQKMTLGLSLLYLPFFLLGYFAAWISGAQIDGYSSPFMFFILFSSISYVLVGLFALRKILRMFFSDIITALTLIFITLGTNLYYYTTLEGTMSHAYNFSLIAVFIYLTIRWHNNPTRQNSIGIGLIYGLITLIRPTNGLIVIFFLLYNIFTFNYLHDKLTLYKSHFTKLALIILFACMVFIPQLLFWKLNTGHWLFWSYSDESFFFGKPEIIRGLFSYRKGWLVYTPLMIFGLAGIYYLRKRLNTLYLPILIFTLLNIYVIFSWWDWSYGGSFGARAMIDSYALFSISLAAVVETVWKSRRIVKIGMVTLFVLLCLFNLFQTAQYKYGAIHFCEMSKESYWHSFGRLSADREFYNLLEPLNYKRLIKGEYATIPKIRETIKPDAETSFESFSRFGTHFLSLDGHYEFNQASCQSNLKSHSGQHSVLLFGDKKYAAGTAFYVSPGERYSVSVWKFPTNANAALVFASIDVKEFYFQQEMTTLVDSSGWGFINFESEIPAKCNGKYRVYVWNKSTDSVFFDDLAIRKLK